MSPGENYVYVVRQKLPSGRWGATYAGFTVDPARRLRQHNGELKGGARATTSRKAAHGGEWAFALIVHSDAFADRHLALSLEWHLKHLPGAGGRGRRGTGKRAKKKQQGDGIFVPEKERLRGIPMRLACLGHALTLAKFASSVPTMVVYAASDLVDDVWAATCDVPDVCVTSLEDLLPGE